MAVSCRFIQIPMSTAVSNLWLTKPWRVNGTFLTGLGKAAKKSKPIISRLKFSRLKKLYFHWNIFETLHMVKKKTQKPNKPNPTPIQNPKQVKTYSS